MTLSNASEQERIDDALVLLTLANDVLAGVTSSSMEQGKTSLRRALHDIRSGRERLQETQGRVDEARD